jgi:DNA polymerase-1
VPGVPGLTKATAKQLIQEFGTIDNLLENIDQIQNPDVREK